ncbi:MAG: molybdenum transporter, periplasmic molybdate-binding protein [Paenibacillus sp.]|nr:molybdenum transporter, periplasmic molybdate-binding protein [Paenibacillus sp.]
MGMERRNVRFRVIWICMIAIALLLGGCSTFGGVTTGEATGGQVELTISAAASLTDALEQIKDVYEKKTDNVTLMYNFGASGALQTQIEEGAPADLFLSAAAVNMKALVDGGFIEESKQTNLLGNELVVVVPADSKSNLTSMQDLQGDEWLKIAIGIPESVPAGNYAKGALEKESLWDALQDKLVQAKDVRQVLSYVETGNADAGFVYRTDAMSSIKSEIAFAVSPDSYPPIHYPVGIVKESKHQDEAAAFYEFLQSHEAHDIFVKHGFTVPR